MADSFGLCKSCSFVSQNIAHGQLLRPLYPGQLHTIRHNLWNAILVLDLSQGTALETVANAFSTMIQRGVPIRFGLVPMFDPEVDDIGRSPF